MGKLKKVLDEESSSNPDINETIVPKPEMLAFELHSDAIYSRQLGDNVASSSGSNLRSFLTGMGFSPSHVDKVIEENGEDNVDLLLEILMECSGPQKSNSQSSDSLDSLFDDKDPTNLLEYSTFVQPKEEPDIFGVDFDKRASLLRMNFSVKEVDFAMEKLGDKEEAVANIGNRVGIGTEFINASLTPRQKSGVISSLQAAGHRVAMVGDGINDAPSLALADVGIALQNEAQENAASNVASIILLGNRLSQVADALDLARATMTKVYQNLSWAIAYNVVAIPIAAGALLPQYDFAMTPSLSGGLMALSSIFVVTNSLLLQLHQPERSSR